MINTRVLRNRLHIAQNQLYLLVLLSLLFSARCKDKSRTDETVSESEELERPVIKSTQDYRDWVAESEDVLTVSRNMEDITYNCRLIPSDYAAIRYTGDERIEKASLEEYQNLVYFDLAIEANSVANPLLFSSESHPAHSDRVHYYSIDFQKDIKAVFDRDTVACELFNFERDNLIRSYLLFHLGFPRAKGKTVKEITLIVDDRCLHTGRHKFYYPKEKLSDIPKLVIQ